MNCPECNAVVDADSKFCKNCGGTLQEPADRMKNIASPHSINEGPDIIAIQLGETRVARPAFLEDLRVSMDALGRSESGLIILVCKDQTGHWARAWVWPVIFAVASCCEEAW
jgi:hypothetical protein